MTLCNCPKPLASHKFQILGYWLDVNKYLHHAPDERGRVQLSVRRQQRSQQGASPVFARRLGVRVPHRPAAALSQPHPTSMPLPACRPVLAGLEDMPSRPMPEVPSAHDGLVRRPRRDLQAWAAHHSPPRPHAIRAKHHRQWGESQVPPWEDRPNCRSQGSSRWCPAPYVLCRPRHLPGLCDYTPAIAHLHRSCGGKESGPCHGRRCQEALRWRREVSSQWPTLDRHGLGDVRRVRPQDAHHDSQDCHSSCWQAQPTPRTYHLPDQSTPFRRASARCWGAADCLRVCRPNVGFAANTNDD